MFEVTPVEDVMCQTKEFVQKVVINHKGSMNIHFRLVLWLLPIILILGCSSPISKECISKIDVYNSTKASISSIVDSIVYSQVSPANIESFIYPVTEFYDIKGWRVIFENKSMDEQRVLSFDLKSTLSDVRVLDALYGDVQNMHPIVDISVYNDNVYVLRFLVNEIFVYDKSLTYLKSIPIPDLKFVDFE
ncbi:MAG: hypothetical protein ACI9FN_001599, partial [Saprospiraceae bacterium]